jgi:hypothetical protein
LTFFRNGLLCNYEECQISDGSLTPAAEDHACVQKRQGTSACSLLYCRKLV